MRTTTKWFVMIFLIPTIAYAKLSTGEKIAITAGAAGIALGTCYLIDALEDLDISITTSPKPLSSDILSDVQYAIRKIKRRYRYELDLAQEYEQAWPPRRREMLEDDLIHAISRYESIAHYRRYLNRMMYQLKDIAHELKDRIDDFHLKDIAPLCPSMMEYEETLHEAQLLVERMATIVSMLDHAYDHYHSVRW